MNGAPRRQTSIVLAWPASVRPSARVIRGIVRASGWRGGLSNLGIVKELWSPSIIMLDIDGNAAALPTVIKLRELLGLMNLTARSVRYDRTEHGYHVVIHLRQRLRLAEAIAVQAILGSDPRREAFNLARARTNPGRFWRARANLLFGERLR